MNQTVKLGTATILLILACTPTLAVDDLTLIRILARADVAQNFASYCAQYDPSIPDRTKSSVGDAQALVLHIRQEVTSGLPQAQAGSIIVRSENAARAGFLLAIRKLYGPDPKTDRGRILDWCETSVVPSLKAFVARHDQHHELFEQTIAGAKQSAQAPAEPSPF